MMSSKHFQRRGELAGAGGRGRRRRAERGWPFLLALLFIVFGTGCRLLRKAADVPHQTIRAVSPGMKEVDPVDVQQKLLRFSDEFAAQMIAGIDKLQRGTNPIEGREMLRWKIGIATEACSISSGPNAFANLLDMTVFVTVSRIALEDHWRPKVYGDSAQPMLDISRSLETNIWSLAAHLLKPAQQEELRQAIAAWRALHPVPEIIIGARAVGFATEVARAKPSETTTPDSVFGMLGLDPLAGLDPAAREIALTRMFAERALHVAKWMPTLMRWQIELLSLNATEMPAVLQLITNSTQLTASVERFSHIAEELPKQVTHEREQILQALQSQEKGLAVLAGELRQTLTAGAQMSTSLNGTLTTFDALMKRFGVGEPKPAGPPKTNSTPFRILDYAQTATQLEGMARQLTELVRSLEQAVSVTNLAKLSAQMAPVVQQAESGGKEVVDHAFRRAIWFVLITSVIVLVAALIYRAVGARMKPANSKSDPR